MQHVKRFAYECILIVGIGVCALMLGCTDKETQNIATVGPDIEINSAATIVRYTRNGQPVACVRFVRGLGGAIWREKLNHCPTLSSIRYASIDGVQAPTWTDPESGNTYRVETTELGE